MVITPLTAKHRVFTITESTTICDSTSVMFALDDAFHFAVLSSKVHVTWALHAGGRLGVGDDPRYLKIKCFEPFPFPDATESQKSRIRELGEQLDAHRKRQQAQHPGLTMTGMYNVLEELRAADSVGQAFQPDTNDGKRQSGNPDLHALTAKNREIHEQGLVSVLRQIHDDLDAAVADAYGWPADLTDEEILARLVALNHERAEEERRGLIRWLRPEFQNPTGAKQTAIMVTDETTTAAVEKKTAKSKPQKWPSSLSGQAGAVHAALANLPAGATAKDIAKTFGRATAQRIDRIDEILETLSALGKARELDNDRYIAV
jgi:hypothetical protein